MIYTPLVSRGCRSLIWIAPLLSGCLYQGGVTKEGTKSSLLHIDTTYETSVRTVRCYTEQGKKTVGPPVAALEEQNRLILEFDVLGTNYKPYGAYLILCDSKWKPLGVPSTRFLSRINRYLINDLRHSMSSSRPYMRYRFPLPEVLRAGNYLVVVHEVANPRDLLLSARFMVYEGSVSVDASAVASLERAAYGRKHRIILQLNQSRLPGAYAATDLLIYVRQNRNWLAVKRIKRPRIKNQNELIYAPAYGESDFCALPSFRRFDTRSLFVKNVGISSWRSNDAGFYHAQLHMDRSRASIPHVPLRDINGGYFIENTEHREAEYTEVKFRLHTKTPLSKKVYVMGSFNQWTRPPEAEMRYDTITQSYQSTLTLKQGYYEYLYWTEGKGFETLEGCWPQSENEYEVLVYYKDRSRGEEPLVGYFRFNGQI